VRGGKLVKRSLGFTLIELMIVLAIIAALAVLVLPSFIARVRHSRRGEVQDAMQAAALAEERVRGDCTTYAGVSSAAGWSAAPAGCMATLGGNPYASAYYTLNIVASATAYTITAQATGAQANDSAFGTPCNPLIYSYANGEISKTPVPCWEQ
jgi:type IV pilus assembly protein PilE